MTLSALRWFKAALVLQVLLLGYWLTIEVVDLFPWNDLGSRSAAYNLRASVAVNALPLLGFLGLFAFGLRPLAMLSVAGQGLYLIGQAWNWWKPYVMGADSDWLLYYRANFSRTLKVLPEYGARLAPDAQHLALHLLIIVTIAAMIVAVSRMRHL